MSKSIVEAILKHGQNRPDKVAVICDEQHISYKELAQAIIGTCNYIKELGVQPNDRVIINAEPEANYIIGYFAIHLLGAVAVPVEKNITYEMLEIINETIDAKLRLITDAESKGIKDALDLKSCIKSTKCEEYQLPLPDNMADILYTTGTTGKSKGVVLNHNNLVATAENIINGIGILEDDVEMVPVPLNHAYGIGKMRALLFKGSTIVLQNGFASLKTIMEKLEKNNCTAISCVPASIKLLYQQSRGRLDLVFGKLRYMEIGTASMDVAMKKEILRLLPNTKICIAYGSTESPRVVYMKLDLEHLLSIGQAACHATIKIVDDYDQVIESSRENVGRLICAGPMNMQGYWRDSNLTKTILKDGWIYTNDIGYMDEEGFIYLLGRKNDVINMGGEKISPSEIENAIIQFKQIQDCACIPVKDPKNVLGEVPVVYYVPEEQDEVDLNELKQFLVKIIGQHKMPVEFIMIEAIPVNYMGKVNKKELVERWRNKNEK